ncbi:hypothetical protein ACTXT7_015103 [Hymenolepis weldensis]
MDPIHSLDGWILISFIRRVWKSMRRSSFLINQAEVATKIIAYFSSPESSRATFSQRLKELTKMGVLAKTKVPMFVQMEASSSVTSDLVDQTKAAIPKFMFYINQSESHKLDPCQDAAFTNTDADA